MEKQVLEELKFINGYRKEAIYEEYCAIVNEPFEYEKITRVKMITAIYDIINSNPSILFYFFDYKELASLIACSQENSKMKERYYRLFITYYDSKSGSFRIPLYIKETIKNIKLDQHVNKIHEILQFTYGVLLTRGVILSNDLEKLYRDLKPEFLELEILDELEQRHKYWHLIKKTSQSKKKVYYHLRPISINIYNDFKNYEAKQRYSFTDYINIAIHGYDLRIEFFEEVASRLRKELIYFPAENFFRSLIITSQEYYENNDEWFLFYLNRAYQNKSRSILNRLRKYIPNWKYQGEVLGFCPCGSGKEIDDCCLNERMAIFNKAMFNEIDAEKFFDNWYSSLFLTNLKHRFNNRFSIHNFAEEISNEEIYQLKELMFNDQEIMKIMKNKLVNKKDYFSISLSEGFTNSILGIFLGLKYIDQKLLMVDIKTQKVYLVSGLSCPLSLKVNSFSLPKFFQTRLIPLNDRIVFDTQINEFRIGLPKNFNELLKQEQFTKIIKSKKDI